MSAEDTPAHRSQNAGGSPRQDTRAATRALKAAAACYTADEFRAFERDMEAGRVDIRLYADGLVIMRIAPPKDALAPGYEYGGE